MASLPHPMRQDTFFGLKRWNPWTNPGASPETPQRTALSLMIPPTLLALAEEVVELRRLYSGVSGHGYKTFTEADGSKVFAKYTVPQVKLPDILGTFEFTGGTGK
jgi:hypothetical protein